MHNKSIYGNHEIKNKKTENSSLSRIGLRVIRIVLPTTSLRQGGIVMRKMKSLLAAAIAVSVMAGCMITEATPAQAAEEDGVVLTLAFHYMDDFFENSVVPIVEEFKKLHPELAEVQFNSLNGNSDEYNVTRLTGGEYEDVILVPPVLLASEWQNYFEPLGSPEEYAAKYYYGDYMQYDGQVYGLPMGVVYEGLVYNKKVLEEVCGHREAPLNLDEFLDDLQKLKEAGVIGIYTNAGSGWTMRYWGNLGITVSEDDDYANKALTMEEPWAEGTYVRWATDLLAKIVGDGCVEPDVVTADQFGPSLTSKGLGETAYMFTGTWALPQAKEYTEAAGGDPDDIGFAPFPYKNDVSADNKLRLRIAQDMFMGVNKNSEHKELAKEFLIYFCENIGQQKQALT